MEKFASSAKFFLPPGGVKNVFAPPGDLCMYIVVSSSGVGRNTFLGTGYKLSKLKYRSTERQPQAKFFTTFVTVCTQIMNGIVNEIEMQDLRMPIAGEIFTTSLTVAHK